ncbi:MAG: ABC transporter permease [Pelistega sp.]|nr:ABC transporter permease [Pelistega sp.]
MLFFKETVEGKDVKQLTLTGDWTIAHYAAIQQALKKFRGTSLTQLSLNEINELDTAGVLLLADVFGKEALTGALQEPSLSKERVAMIDAVMQALPTEEDLTPPKKPSFFALFFGNIGLSVTSLWSEFLNWMGFFGMVILAFLRMCFSPPNWRMTSLVANIDSSGFKATPIVMLLCFMVGAVVAFLGATVLETFGAQVFTVHLVTYSFLREFAIILTAILIAGRTASAYTAQLGSMKVNEEIDALKASGVDPLATLVVPRVLALIIAMPILTFLGMVAGIFGGMLVSTFAMDISPRLFFDIMNESIHVKHFLVGIGKAPIFAIVIAITGCLEGFKVSGSAESVGQHTTSSVVKCIFLVILLDALFAIFFMEMGW